MKKWIFACVILTMALVGCSSTDETSPTSENPSSDVNSKDLIDQVFNENNQDEQDQENSSSANPSDDTSSTEGTPGSTQEQTNLPPLDQLYPVKETKHNEPNKVVIKDQSSQDQSLKLFIDDLKKTVHLRDAQALTNVLANDIKYSFGGDIGKENFIKYWKLDLEPQQSNIWQELEEMLVLGGDFFQNGQQGPYFIPYLFVHFPEQFDAYTHLGVIGEKVNVREKPDIKSKVVDQLSYDIVKMNGANSKETYSIEGRDYPWVPVVTPTGKEGYIVEKFVRSPIDYRLAIDKNEQGNWEIYLFIAGD